MEHPNWLKSSGSVVCIVAVYNTENMSYPTPDPAKPLLIGQTHIPVGIEFTYTRPTLVQAGVPLIVTSEGEGMMNKFPIFAANRSYGLFEVLCGPDFIPWTTALENRSALVL